MVISITFSLTSLTGVEVRGAGPTRRRDMRQDQIGCAAILGLAIDVINIAVRMRRMRAWAF